MTRCGRFHQQYQVAGLGLVHTLDFAARPAIRRGELVPILQAWCPKPLLIYIAYLPSRQLSSRVRVFVEWATELYGRLTEC